MKGEAEKDAEKDEAAKDEAAKTEEDDDENDDDEDLPSASSADQKLKQEKKQAPEQDGSGDPAPQDAQPP